MTSHRLVVTPVLPDAWRAPRASVIVSVLTVCALTLGSGAWSHAWAHGGGHWNEDAVADTSAPLVVSVDFDPPNGVRRADPALYTSFDAYVVLTGANPANLPGGLRTITLRLAVSEGTSSTPRFESLLPSKLVIGGWRDGLMMASAPCEADDAIVLGVLHLFYLGKPGVVEVRDHPDYPRWIVDCEDVDHRYVVGSIGGIHRDPPPVEPGGKHDHGADGGHEDDPHDHGPGDDHDGDPHDH